MARQEGRKITEFDALDIVVSRLIGIPLEKIAEVYGVSKQAVLYHENKNHVLELRTIILQRAAEIVGDEIGEIMLNKLRNADVEAFERGALALLQAKKEINNGDDS